MLLRVRWTWTDAPLKYKGVSQNSTTGRHTVVKKLEAVQNLQDEPGRRHVAAPTKLKNTSVCRICN